MAYAHWYVKIISRTCSSNGASGQPKHPALLITDFAVRIDSLATLKCRVKTVRSGRSDASHFEYIFLCISNLIRVDFLR